MLEAEPGPLTCEICILAGGKSQRMGRDKAPLPLGDTTMLGQIQATARATGWPVRVIRRDVIPRCGPLGGVYTALQTTQRDAVLFLACDMPFVSPQLLSDLVEHFRSARRPLFVSCQGRVGFPFLLPRQALAVTAAQVRRGQFSLQTLARALRAKKLNSPGGLEPQLRNVNTPADWKEVRKAWHRARKMKLRPAKDRMPIP